MTQNKYATVTLHYTQTFTRGTLVGLSIKQTLSWATLASAHEWQDEMTTAKAAKRVGYTVTDCRVEVAS